MISVAEHFLSRVEFMFFYFVISASAVRFDM